MLILPDASERSLDLLREAIADRFRITMIVMGDGSGQDVIASKADVRAQAMASTRRVVWVRDTDVLRNAGLDHLMRPGACLCVLDLDDRPVVWLSPAQANRFTELERAFLKAQHGGDL
jgi:hypothetical protein